MNQLWEALRQRGNEFGSGHSAILLKSSHPPNRGRGTEFAVDVKGLKMVKLNFFKKDYWVGYHATLGYLIYDPLVQHAEQKNLVRLYIVKRRRSSSFDKAVVKKHLKRITATRLDKCRQMATPYARARIRQRTNYCHYCLRDLRTADFGICDHCGWIQCPCGACGCNHRPKKRRACASRN